jgi:hypothetical protein
VVGVFAFGGEFSSWYFDFGMNDFGEINHVRGASRRDSNEEREGKKGRKELFLIY